MKISRNTIILISAVVLIAIIILLYFVFGNKAPVRLTSVDVKSGDITESINLNGQVKASQGVDLSFESQGKIVANYVKVGDKIYAGQPLVAIDSSILRSQLKQAQAQLDILNVGTVENKTNSSLQVAYQNALSAAQKSAGTAKNILLTITDIQNNHFTNQSTQTVPLFNAKQDAILSLLGQSTTSLSTSEDLAPLNGGTFGLVQTAVQNPTQGNIDAALLALKTSLQNVNNMIDAMPITDTVTPAERVIINTSKINIGAEVVTTTTNMQAIANLKVNNSATVSTANAQLEAAQANVDAIRAQLAKTVIVALFNGQVDKDNVVVGQLVSPNAPVVTISNDNLEIDTSISEIDLPNAKLGAKANVTLDAYGNGVNFPATIFSVDTAPTITNGILAYNARLKFDNLDNRIKSGMTANITMISDTHANVLVVPKSAVIQNNGNYLVLIDGGNGKKETRQVTVGLHDDKNIEITSGLKLGEKVLTY
jgi:HlyD family secretion protein